MSVPWCQGGLGFGVHASYIAMGYWCCVDSDYSGDPEEPVGLGCSRKEAVDNFFEQAMPLPEAGTCETCNKREGTRRRPYIADKQEAERMSYISCDPCFQSVWKGEL